MKLKESGVVFDPVNHTYCLNGVYLTGITGIISRYIFPDKYAGIPRHILDNAAKRGSKVHSDCEFYDRTGFEMNTPEASSYARIKRENGMSTLANEYIVTDGKHIATAIDLVFSMDSKLCLSDIKTTYKFDDEYVSWQLSINAFLFELQNKKLKVDHLYGIWLNGKKGFLIPVDRKPDEEVKSLLDLAVYDMANGIEATPLIIDKAPYPAEIRDAENEIILLETQLGELNFKRDELKKGLMSLMVSHGINKYESDRLRLTRKEATVSKRFDSAAFKKDYPQLYDSYLKDSEVSESLIIKILQS